MRCYAPQAAVERAVNVCAASSANASEAARYRQKRLSETIAIRAAFVVLTYKVHMRSESARTPPVA